MKNIKKIISIFMASLMFSISSVKSLSVSATSVGDVIAHAYAIGMPESEIQTYISMGSGREWTSDQCDQAIAILDSMYGKRDDAIIEGGETNPDPEVVPEPVTPEEFVEMNVEEKKDYIDNIPTEEKKEYLDLMTNEEKNKLLKELDVSQQVDFFAGMLGFGDTFGYDFSIEDMQEGNIMISARDDSGKLVGVTIIGDSVEKTGIPYTVPVMIALTLIVSSLTGIVILIRKCRQDYE